MYILPQRCKCLKCGFETLEGQHDDHPAPRVKGDVFCPKCWLEFLTKNIGILECTVVLNKSGISNYDKAMKELDK